MNKAFNDPDFLKDFLSEDKEGTVCDLNGNCTPKLIRPDKSIVERVNKTIIIEEDGRQLLI